jgi:cation diffusion facilitator family transporter
VTADAGRSTGLPPARRTAAASLAASLMLATTNILVGLATGSTSVVAVGVEFAGDVLASAVVFVGLQLASRPPDANHPYGHGRLETIAGLFVGVILITGGAGISYRSMTAAAVVHAPPGIAAVWTLVIAIGVRAAMSALKFRVGRRTGSLALVSDAWNDAVDIIAASAALTAVLMARVDPARFLAADHYGGFAVGLIVVTTGVRVVGDASRALADTMPAPARMDELRAVAMSVAGVLGVEKQFARKTGLQYHVDLHLEVDPDMTVRDSHEIGHDVKSRVLAELPWVADVLVHVEPAPEGAPAPAFRAAP